MLHRALPFKSQVNVFYQVPPSTFLQIHGLDHNLKPLCTDVIESLERVFQSDFAQVCCEVLFAQKMRELSLSSVHLITRV